MLEIDVKKVGIENAIKEAAKARGFEIRDLHNGGSGYQEVVGAWKLDNGDFSVATKHPIYCLNRFEKTRSGWALSTYSNAGLINRGNYSGLKRPEKLYLFDNKKEMSKFLDDCLM